MRDTLKKETIEDIVSQEHLCPSLEPLPAVLCLEMLHDRLHVECMLNIALAFARLTGVTGTQKVQQGC